MKKLIALALMMVAFSGVAGAQKVQFGLKVGADLTNFWGKRVGHGMKAGYQVGALMEWHFNDRLSLAPEAVFAAQGGKVKGLTYHLNYINIPIMLKYYITPQWSIDLGPQVGFKVHDGFSGDNWDALFKPDAIAGDMGVGLGCTYSLTDNAFVQVRYTLGLSVVYDDSTAKNSNIQLSFGWKF